MYDPWVPTSTGGLLTYLDVAPVLDRQIKQATSPQLTQLPVQAFNGPILSMSAVRPSQVIVRPSTYFAGLLCGDVLAAHLDGPVRDRVDVLADGDPLHDATGRIAPLAVCVALICELPDGPQLLLGRRAPTVAAYPSSWHLAPSGMIEPDHVTLAQTIAEELREEVLHDATDRQAAAAVGGAQVLGVGFDLVRLRAEIVVRATLPCQEIPVLCPGEFTDVRLVPYTAAGLLSAYKLMVAEGGCPSGAAALALLDFHLN